MIIGIDSFVGSSGESITSSVVVIVQKDIVSSVVKLKQLVSLVDAKVSWILQFVVSLFLDIKNCWFLAAPLTVNNQYLTNISLKINVKLGGLNSILPRRDFLSVLSVSEAPTMIVGIDSFVGSLGESIPSSVVVIVHKGLGIGHREGLVEVRGLGQSK
ncbi:hypothetical protein V8G54_021734, partial [Vigna mungo]